MFCGNIFTSTDLQNHKKNHMKKSQKRFHRVNRALFLSLSNAFEEQKFMPKISPKNSLFSQNCLWGTVWTPYNKPLALFFVFWSRTISFGQNVPKFFSRKVAFLQHYTGTPVTFRSKNYQLSLVYLQNHTKEHMEKSKMPAGRPFFLLITILAQNIYQK